MRQTPGELREGFKEYATAIPDLPRIERLEPVGFGGPLLLRHQHKSAMALQKTGHKFYPDVVGLAGFDVQVDHGPLVVRPEGVLPGVEPDTRMAHSGGGKAEPGGSGSPFVSLTQPIG
jgi:hypothetical protein